MSPDWRRPCRLQTLRHTDTQVLCYQLALRRVLSLTFPLFTAALCGFSFFLFVCFILLRQRSRIWYSRRPYLVRLPPLPPFPPPFWLRLEKFSWTKISTWPAFLLRTWYLRILILDSCSRLWRLDHPRLSSALLNLFTWNAAYNLPPHIIEERWTRGLWASCFMEQEWTSTMTWRHGY